MKFILIIMIAVFFGTLEKSMADEFEDALKSLQAEARAQQLYFQTQIEETANKTDKELSDLYSNANNIPTTSPVLTKKGEIFPSRLCFYEAALQDSQNTWIFWHTLELTLNL